MEESLRRETLINEEQRTYIQVLRESLEVKLTQMNLSFKGSTSGGLQIDSNVDGFLQLLNTQRMAESLKADNAQLIASFKELQVLQERKEADLTARYQAQIED